MVLLSLVILLASGEEDGGAVSVDEMRESVISSMKTTVALTAPLIEQLTKKIRDLTDFADGAKEEIKDLKSKIDALAAEDKALESKLADSEGKLAKGIEAVKEAVTEKMR